MLEVLNLGAGVQSTAVLLMSCFGELPKLDCAIFADTGWEPKAVYRHLGWLSEVAAQHGIPVHRVHRRSIKEDALGPQSGKRKGRWGSMPFFVQHADGTYGTLKRQCTNEYKVQPIECFIKTQLLGLPIRSRYPTRPVVRRWYGISADEFERVSAPVATARKKTGTDLLGNPVYATYKKPLLWCTNYYPLIGIEISGTGHKRAPGKPLTRQDCRQWLASRGFSAPRSACIGCPYHNDEYWLYLKCTSPDEFEDACQFDETMRTVPGIRGRLFLHRSCRPLREVEFSHDDSWNGCETGYCFT